jgi:hypothetical protein
MPNFMKSRPVGSALSHADGRTDRHDEANSRRSQFCERTYKTHKYHAVQILLALSSDFTISVVKTTPLFCGLTLRLYYCLHTIHLTT